MKPPTPEEFYKNMLKIKNMYSIGENQDTEMIHIKFDEYIC